MMSMYARAAAHGLAALERGVCSMVQLPKLGEWTVANEPVLEYRAGSSERAALQQALRETSDCTEEVPIVIGDECVFDGEPRYQVMPHDHSKKIAKYYYASEKTIKRAIDVAVAAQQRWDRVPLSERVAVWERAAAAMAGEQRQRRSDCGFCNWSQLGD